MSIFDPRPLVRVNRFSFDKAIDTSNPECSVVMYQFTRDEKHLRFVKGEEPTRFVLLHLSHKFSSQVLDKIADPAERLRLAFRAACTEVTIPGADALVPDPSKRIEFVGGVMVAGEEWSDRIATKFGLATVKEFGQVAFDTTQLPEGADGPFVWPPGSDRSR